MEEMIKEIEKLKSRIEALEQRRIYQQDIVPDSVKTRHIGEGVPYILSGLAANRPTAGALVTQGASCYWATDTGVLSIWNGTAWLSETFS